MKTTYEAVVTFSPEFVIYALRSAGFRQTDVAKRIDRSIATVCSVVNGRARSKRVENCIASLTRVPLERLWPQWYGPNAIRRKKALTGAQRLENAKALVASLELLNVREAA